jgi:2,3-bisphosphoglycerate-dependent phosphoglycerate mutase
MPGKLILVRHQESEWNRLGRWTGSRNIHLTEKGFKRSNKVGSYIKNLDIYIDNAFASMQVRSIETLSCILETCGMYNIPTQYIKEFNERDYGDYTGNNKWEMEKQLGEESFMEIRRGFNFIPPHGESLKVVYDRVVPYFLENVLPLINSDKNVIIVGHGNSLRSLLKYIESLSDEEIEKIEFSFNKILILELDNKGKSWNKVEVEINF